MMDNLSQQEPVRIFLAIRPRMVRQMLRRTIHRIPNLSVVGESNQPKSIVKAPEKMTIDWLVVSLTQDGKIPEKFSTLTDKYPSLRLLGMSLDGDELELRDEESEEYRHYNDVSLKTLIALFQDKYRQETSIH